MLIKLSISGRARAKQRSSLSAGHSVRDRFVSSFGMRYGEEMMRGANNRMMIMDGTSPLMMDDVLCPAFPFSLHTSAPFLHARTIHKRLDAR